ncbi:MAG: ATP-dependent helicase C-terminal domain-containing protein, partial [Myxococcota bacterium]
HWDEERRQVVARRRVCIEDLILESQAAALPNDGRVLDCLVEAVSKDLEQLPLTDPEVQGLLARMHHLHSVFPDKEVPEPTTEWLRDSLPAVLSGLRGLTRLSASALRNRLWEHLSYPQRQALDQLAPEHYVVPSGSRKRLTWTREGPPVLAVRMQEIFGLTQTPRVLGGRVPVLLHLLAPNGRPAQITHDLESFWQNTWTEVRSELRRRYPKHSWPEDGRDAAPERRPKRRR